MPMPWTQTYDPLASPVLSTLLAALPIVLLLGLLATGRVSAHLAALAGLLCAVLAAIFGFTPPEAASPGRGGTTAWAVTVLAAAGHGAAFGLFPIGWIVLAAIFLYSLTVETGQFEIVKQSVMSLSADRRIQALLIAFCFGAFIEGAAGFGTPVAISAALLMGAGFKPIQAAGLALIANTSPVAFGALGTPIITLADVTLPPDVSRAEWEMRLSQMAGRQLPFFSLIVPVWLVATMGGWRAVRGVWPALAVCGGSFALVQFLVANYVGPALVDVAGGLLSLLALALFLLLWQPAPDPEFSGGTARLPHGTTPGTVLRAWVPWLLLSLFVFLAGERHIRDRLEGTKPFPWQSETAEPVLKGISVAEVTVPQLHERIRRTPPVVPEPLPGEEIKPEKAVYRLNWLSATGTAIFLAAIFSAAWLRVAPHTFARTFLRTCVRMRWPLVTIACMLALAYVTRYSGMDATLGLAFTRTGWLYPLFAALLGWLGVALTGSDTSSNALFGSLQKITAEGLVRNGVLPATVTEGQAVVLLATANSTGGVMGKMIDAQSIVVSAAATQQPGQEGPILRFVFWHSIALAILMGLLVLVQAYLWTGVIP
jgi:lactate permease